MMIPRWMIEYAIVAIAIAAVVIVVLLAIAIVVCLLGMRERRRRFDERRAAAEEEIVGSPRISARLAARRDARIESDRAARIAYGQMGTRPSQVDDDGSRGPLSPSPGSGVLSKSMAAAWTDACRATPIDGEARVRGLGWCYVHRKWCGAFGAGMAK